MKDHVRRRLAKPGETVTVSPPRGQPAPAGIPLLLLPERVLLDVDASLLMGPLSPENADHSMGVKGVAVRLVRLWLRPWEF